MYNQSDLIMLSLVHILDPDWVGWEQSYNCGHDEAMFEVSARWAGWSKSRGVIYFSASGAWAPSTCSPSSDPKPYSDEDWTEESAGLKKWIPTQKDIAAEKATLNEYYSAKPSASRFMGSWHNAKGYNGIGPHGKIVLFCYFNYRCLILYTHDNFYRKL